MTPEIPHLKADESPDAMRDVLDEVGAVIVEGMVDDLTVDTMLGELAADIAAADPEMEHLNPGLQWFFQGVRNVTGLPARSPTFVDALLLHPVLLALADDWFAPVASDYLLNVAHLLVREPGTEQQLLHRDEDVWMHLVRLIEQAEPRPEVELASITALCDFTREIGATAVVPGSHRWDRNRTPQPDEIAYAEMPRGSSVIYRGSTIHAGGTNSTEQPRAAVHLSYVAGWLRTEECNLLATRPEVARALPRRAQELVGYGYHDAIDIGGGFLGAVDLQSPTDLLSDGRL